MYDYESNPEAKGVEYQITEVDPTDSETKGKVYQVYRVSEEVAATMAGKIYRARIIKDPTEPTVVGKVYQVVFIDDPDDPSVKGKVYNAIVVGGSQVVVIGPAVSPLILPDAIAGGLVSLKAFGGTKQGVPGGYTRVEYLQADGNQSIPLNITGINKRVEIDAQYTGASASTAKILAGYDSNYGATFFGVYTNKWGLTLSNVIGDATVRTLVKCVFNFNSSGYNSATITAGGETLTYARTSTRPDKTLTLFGYSSYGFIGKIYGCQIYDNYTNELLFDGIPAVRNSDSVAGLYDSVSGAFLENADDEPFSVGPNVIPTPTTPIDIVCNNGVLKAKDADLPVGYKRLLGYACNNDVLWQITDFHLRGSDTLRISFSIDAGCNVFGCYQGADATDNYDLYASTSSGAKYLRYGNGTYLSYFSSANLGRRFDVVFSPTGTTGMPQDSTWSPMTFESGNDFLVGATTLTGSSSKLKGNLYGNIIVDGRLKLIPCERVSDGVLGYFDTYSQTFYEPQGAATSLGYDDSYITEVYADGTVETINVHGKNLIDVADFRIPNNSSSSTLWTGSMTGVFRLSLDKSEVVSVAGPSIRFLEIIVNGETRYITYNDCDSISIKGTLTSIKCYNAQAYARVSGKISLQLERGTTTTPYEPYYNGGTATTEMLLKVGDYQDVQSILDGAITRNVGVKVLDGTENWILSGGTGVWANFQSITGVTFGTTSAVCTHSAYAGADVSVANMNQNEFSLFANGNIAFKNANTTSTSDWTTFLSTQYAAGTPVIVLYPLATATTESVTGQTLQVQAGDNYLEITQASIGGLELEAQYNAAVSLTIQEVEDANLDNNVTVTIQ